MNARAWLVRSFRLILSFLLVTLPANAGESAHSFSFRNSSTFKIDGESFDLATSKGLSRFQIYASKLLEQGSSSDGSAELEKKDLRGIREMLRLAEALNGESDDLQKSGIKRDIAEIAAAI